MKNPVLSALAAFLALAIAASPVACTKQQQATFKSDAIACMKQDLGQTVTEAGVSLLMAVVAIVATGGTDWMTDLTALGKKYGPDALACASKIATDLFKPLATQGPSTADADSPYSRAEQALAQFASGRKLQ